jgi:hypothetical protein
MIAPVTAKRGTSHQMRAAKAGFPFDAAACTRCRLWCSDREILTPLAYPLCRNILHESTVLIM